MVCVYERQSKAYLLPSTIYMKTYIKNSFSLLYSLYDSWLFTVVCNGLQHALIIVTIMVKQCNVMYDRW